MMEEKDGLMKVMLPIVMDIKTQVEIIRMLEQFETEFIL
jgi:hypothetical protein